MPYRHQFVMRLSTRGGNGQDFVPFSMPQRVTLDAGKPGRERTSTSLWDLRDILTS
jgi:hypothetical protein